MKETEARKISLLLRSIDFYQSFIHQLSDTNENTIITINKMIISKNIFPHDSSVPYDGDEDIEWEKISEIDFENTGINQKVFIEALTEMAKKKLNELEEELKKY